MTQYSADNWKLVKLRSCCKQYGDVSGGTGPLRWVIMPPPAPFEGGSNECHRFVVANGLMSKICRELL